ncbi:CoA ester lyase [Micromonospora sp. HUAS LYJ1]|uniref:HpcH/HpaI aldolase/citrate lyase family protein n=1 Tax=Micromonospora sp. HUAS LYJ1 TaxID=3061626 RepID=UPI0026711EB3|nr:CoA ester lyase [Micromonospora sp. HUAS LYJ1]WKU03554.1 CoA ester lyase [Micromonospora sp. HUAS LYJ1]
MTVDADSARARSWLFVPGSRAERFAKATASGADQVILDLEDAVDAGVKDRARDDVVEWLRRGGHAWVRTNGVATRWWDCDVAALKDAGPGLLGLVLPKADTRAVAVAADRTHGSLPLVALVETAGGLRDASGIAAHPAVAALAFGALDYALDVGVTDDTALDFARHTLVLATRAGGAALLIDGVSAAVTDTDAVTRDAARARALGFGGKLCIHPAQIAAVHHGFAPTADEVAWATRVVASADALPPERAGAFRVDGRMVDRPVLLRARRLLAQTERPLGGIA